MESNEKENFLTKAKNLFKKNNYRWTKIAIAILAVIIVAIILTVTLVTCDGHKHTYATTWSKDETSHWYAATCGHDVKKDEAEHTFGEWEVVTAETAATKGSKKRACTVCGYEDVAEIAVLTHTHTLVHHETVDATSTSNGNIEYWSCSGCDKYFSDSTAATEITDKSSVAVKYYSKGLEYTLSSDENSYYVSGIGTCSDTDIFVPSIYEGKAVVGIGDYAFAMSSITSITLPDSVTAIWEHAFDNCTRLTSIDIPDSVTDIGDYAFYACSSLTTVEIPDSVTTIGKDVFEYCGGLISIVIPDGITGVGGSAFYQCAALTYIVIPDSVTSVGNLAFYDCASLTSVYYKGTPTKWNDISIGTRNDKLTAATRYYYSEKEPTDTDNKYWHYVDGVPTVW